MAVEVVSVEQFGGMPDVAEIEPDFKGNARLKADAARTIVPHDHDIWVLADDSGLSVGALDGAPGVHSARFAGPEATDEDNRNKLLSLLEGKSAEERKAHFTCHLCLISPAGEVFHFEGKCQGTIAFSTSGTDGFGYDSLFIPNGALKTWGESAPEVKNRESHRGQAAKKMLNWLRFYGIVKK
jgi:XTP/dITP diphosphohydrolase